MDYEAVVLEKGADDFHTGPVGPTTGESLLRLEGEEGKVRRVVTDRRTLPAELVVIATGVRPNAALTNIYRNRSI